MNKKIIYTIIAVLIIAVVGVGIYFAVSSANKSKEVSSNDNKEDIFKFSYNGKDIILGDEFSIENCGKENTYSEIASCAFQGLDKTYTYDHHEITTYPDGNKDKIFSVLFLDEKATTVEGVKVSDSYDDMVQAYGTNYENEGNLYTYTKGKTSLNFIVENEIITSIEYVYDA